MNKYEVVCECVTDKAKTAHEIAAENGLHLENVRSIVSALRAAGSIEVEYSAGRLSYLRYTGIPYRQGPDVVVVPFQDWLDLAFFGPRQTNTENKFPQIPQTGL